MKAKKSVSGVCRLQYLRLRPFGFSGQHGIVYRDEKAKAWATMLNTDSGIKSILDVDETAKFLNPPIWRHRITSSPC